VRPVLALAACFGAVVLARPALAQQTYPADMVITVPEVEVRSGPSSKYYPTSKLVQNDVVRVLRESPTQKGWLAIEPPRGSFSWIKADAVVPTGPSMAVVKEETTARPGSSLTNDPPNVEQVSVKAGSLVIILDKPNQAAGGTWLPIQPPPSEVRYIPNDAVKLQQFAKATPPTSGTSLASNPLIAQADQALSLGQTDRARKLYKDAADQTTDQSQKIYCLNRLNSLHASGWSAAQPGPPTNAGRVVGQTASLVRPAAAAKSLYDTGNTWTPGGLNYPSQWSVWGILQPTAFARDGKPMYVLTNKQGQPLLYATIPSGRTLRDYVGKTVSLYGPISYRSDEYMRTHYMTVSHVALP
jgi:hypothetical protein